MYFANLGSSVLFSCVFAGFQIDYASSKSHLEFEEECSCRTKWRNQSSQQKCISACHRPIGDVVQVEILDKMAKSRKVAKVCIVDL